MKDLNHSGVSCKKLKVASRAASLLCTGIPYGTFVVAMH